MTANKTRQKNLVYWADKIGRDALAQKAGYPDTNYLNQLYKSHGSFGGGTARKFEKALGLEEGEFDKENPYTKTEGINSETFIATENVTISHSISRKLPLVSLAQAGSWSSLMPPHDRHEMGRFTEWVDWLGDCGERDFVIRIVDSAMFNARSNDGYQIGSLVKFEPDVGAVHGDDVIIKTLEGTVIFRCLQKTSEGDFLQTVNPDWPDSIVKMPEGSVICGVAGTQQLPRRRR